MKHVAEMLGENVGVIRWTGSRGSCVVERGAGITNHMFLHGENQLTDQNSCVETRMGYPRAIGY
jgi:hypothetical protein